jgi:hypothetical protein
LRNEWPHWTLKSCGAVIGINADHKQVSQVSRTLQVPNVAYVQYIKHAICCNNGLAMRPMFVQSRSQSRPIKHYLTHKASLLVLDQTSPRSAEFWVREGGLVVI